MFAVTVTLKIKSDQIAPFMALMRANAAASLRNEPGCHQFDVCHNDGDEVLLYELYQNSAAFDDHLAAAHFLEFDKATADMLVDKQVRTFAEVIQ